MIQNGRERLTDGKTVRNDKCHFGGSARPFFEQLPRTAVETSTEIGAAQVRESVRGRRAQPNGLQPDLTEFGNDPFGIECRVDGVPGAGVRQLEIEVIRGRQSGTSAPQTNSRGSGTPQIRPGNLSGTGHWSRASKARTGRIEAGSLFGEAGPIKLPLRSVNPIRSSHSANSGAGCLFRTRRR